MSGSNAVPHQPSLSSPRIVRAGSRRGPVNDEYLRVSHMGSMRETIRQQVRRLLQATVSYRIYRRFSFADHDNSRQDHDNA